MKTLSRSCGRLLRRPGATALLVASLVVGIARAAEGSGPSTGAIVALAFEPAGHSLLKASAHELYRSNNDGQDWQPISLPAAVRRGSIASVAVSARTPAILYVGGHGFGVLRSTDGGRSWRATNDGLPAHDVATLTAHADQPRTLYAYLPRHGIYRSEDAGDHWRLMDAGSRQTIVKLVHSDMPGSMQTGWLFAATARGVNRSMDCLCGWHDAGALRRPVSAVAYDPQAPSQVYAVSADEFFVSAEGGEKWTRATSPGSPVTGLVVAGNGIVYAAVGEGELLRSVDHGKTWLRVDG